MAPLRWAAKFDPFLSFNCARVEGVGPQSKERKGSNFCHLATLAQVFLSTQDDRIQWIHSHHLPHTENAVVGRRGFPVGAIQYEKFQLDLWREK